jgi:psiF repeat-containing protein
MRTQLSVLIGLAILATGPVFGATAQQEKMKSCNADATSKSLKGDARKDFMKSCLSSSGSATAAKKELTPQQQKMSDCSKDAKTKNLSGDARKQFMSTCLKGT